MERDCTPSRIFCLKVCNSIRISASANGFFGHFNCKAIGCDFVELSRRMALVILTNIGCVVFVAKIMFPCCRAWSPMFSVLWIFFFFLRIPKLKKTRLSWCFEMEEEWNMETKNHDVHLQKFLENSTHRSFFLFLYTLLFFFCWFRRHENLILFISTWASTTFIFSPWLKHSFSSLDFKSGNFIFLGIEKKMVHSSCLSFKKWQCYILLYSLFSSHSRIKTAHKITAMKINYSAKPYINALFMVCIVTKQTLQKGIFL